MNRLKFNRKRAKVRRRREIFYNTFLSPQTLKEKKESIEEQTSKGIIIDVSA